MAMFVWQAIFKLQSGDRPARRMLDGTDLAVGTVEISVPFDIVVEEHRPCPVLLRVAGSSRPNS